LQLETQLYKMHLFCSLHTQHRATAGHVTRLSSSLSPLSRSIASHDAKPKLKIACLESKSNFAVVRKVNLLS